MAFKAWIPSPAHVDLRFEARLEAVAHRIEVKLDQLLVGRNVDRIERSDNVTRRKSNEHLEGHRRRHRGKKDGFKMIKNEHTHDLYK